MASLDSSPAIVGKRPAAFDLLDMLRAIERQLLCKLPGHRIERPWRHVHRAGTDTHAAWNRITRMAATRA
jgi:hypothetical protein